MTMMPRNTAAYVIMVGLAVILETTVAQAGEAQAPIEFFSQYCVKCHNSNTHKGDIRLDWLTLQIDADNADLWQDIVHNIQRGDMPPEDAKQPPAGDRRTFLRQLIRLLQRYATDANQHDDPLMRLTNSQIAHSIQDLLSVSRDISVSLIEDPVDKHGFSRQSELDVSGNYLELYLDAVRQAVTDAIPDTGNQVQVYRVAGSDWEKQHYLNKWDLRPKAHRTTYRGPRWLGDSFEIPLPPKHEYRMYLHENRSEGEFRIRLIVFNEPPTKGDHREPQELSVFLDEGFRRPYKLVGNLTVPAKAGRQQFDLFGNLRDYLGVNPGPIEGDTTHEQTRSSKYRILSIQNLNPLQGFRPAKTRPNQIERFAQLYLVRPDDQWIDAFGEEFAQQNRLLRSYGGSSDINPPTRKLPAIYSNVMKTHGHVIIKRVEFEVPWYSSWPPSSLQAFLTDGQLDRQKLPDRLEAFAAKAWRHPLDESEQRWIHKVVNSELAAGSPEIETLRNTLVAILADPKFLYLSHSTDHARLRNFELVSRLSYFLWNGPPDDQLLTLADRKPKLDDQTLERQVDRLLADDRSRRFVKEFTSRWIGFSQLEQIAVNPNYYPTWLSFLKNEMKGECVAFFSELLRKDISCLNLLDSDFMTVNEPLAQHYGITPEVSGRKFMRVPAPAGRGGVLTQAAVLLAYSNGEDAHAVNRGVWLRARLLGDPPSDPPPATPALADQNPAEVDDLSIRQILEKHRVGTCYDCHKNIDPYGIAMEGFDAVGLPRENILRIHTQNNGKQMLPVVKDVEIDGQTIDGMNALKNYLIQHCSEDFARSFTRHMLSYALGRTLSYRDDQEIVALQTTFRNDDHRMRTLIKAIVTGPLFKLSETSNHGR